MATYTTNYHLEKPAQSDLYNIDVFNGNADIIDTTLVSKSNLSNIATVESTNKASKAYAKGDYLVYEGTLYKVTANIANGGTLTVGTNITATSAGGELTSLNDSLLTCPKLVSGGTSWATSFSYNTGSTAGIYLLVGARGDMRVIETFSDGTGAVRKITSETTASNLWNVTVSSGVINGSITTNSAYVLLKLT